jgi:hypothetical protein
VARVEVIGEIARIEVIASGRGVAREAFLRKTHGGTRWRKLKGVASVRDELGQARMAELDWYEAHGVGRRGLEIKRFLD